MLKLFLIFEVNNKCVILYLSIKSIASVSDVVLYIVFKCPSSFEARMTELTSVLSLIKFIAFISSLLISFILALAFIIEGITRVIVKINIIEINIKLLNLDSFVLSIKSRSILSPFADNKVSIIPNIISPNFSSINLNHRDIAIVITKLVSKYMFLFFSFKKYLNTI